MGRVHGGHLRQVGGYLRVNLAGQGAARAVDTSLLIGFPLEFMVKAGWRPFGDVGQRQDLRERLYNTVVRTCCSSVRHLPASMRYAR